MTAPAIELDRVQKRWGDFILGPLSLAVPRGAISALIGPNGAGKTTTLDLLMGMGEPDGGHIRMLGWELPRDEVEMKRREGFGEVEMNRRVRYRQIRWFGLVQPGSIECPRRPIDGIDQPDVLDTHHHVIAQANLGAGEAVFRRKHFNAEQRGSLRNSLARRISAQRSNIADSDAMRSNADALFYNTGHVPFTLVLTGDVQNKKLQPCVRTPPDCAP